MRQEQQTRETVAEQSSDSPKSLRRSVRQGLLQLRRILFKNTLIVIIVLVLPLLLFQLLFINWNRQINDVTLEHNHSAYLQRTAARITHEMRQISGQLISTLLRFGEKLHMLASKVSLTMDDARWIDSLQKELSNIVNRVDYIYAATIKDDGGREAGYASQYGERKKADITDWPEFDLGEIDASRVIFKHETNWPTNSPRNDGFLTLTHELTLSNRHRCRFTVVFYPKRFVEWFLDNAAANIPASFLCDKEGRIMLGNIADADEAFLKDVIDRERLNFFDTGQADDKMHMTETGLYYKLQRIEPLDMWIVSLSTRENNLPLILSINMEVQQMMFFAAVFLFVIGVIIALQTYMPIRKIVRQIEIRFKRSGFSTENGTDDREYNAGRSKDELAYIQSYLDRSSALTSELRQELNKRMAMLEKEQLFTLQTQINPHFLYNTLDAINWRAITELQHDNVISQATRSLSKILKSATVANVVEHTVEQEVELVREYIHIEHLLRGKTFETFWAVDPELLSQPIMKLSIQPLVENSLQHGFKETDKKNYLLISVQRGDDGISVSVQDNGSGIPAAKLAELRSILADDYQNPPARHIGLANVSYRLVLLYGDSARLSLDSKENVGTECHFSYREDPRHV